MEVPLRYIPLFICRAPTIISGAIINSLRLFFYARMMIHMSHHCSEYNQPVDILITLACASWLLLYWNSLYTLSHIVYMHNTRTCTCSTGPWGHTSKALHAHKAYMYISRHYIMKVLHACIFFYFFARFSCQSNVLWADQPFYQDSSFLEMTD